MALEFTNQDARQLLSKIKDNSVDLILTDPPYEISRKSGMGDAKAKGEQHKFAYSIDFGEWDHSFDISDYIGEFYRVLKKSGTLIIWFDLWKLGDLKSELECNKFSKIRMLEWLKTNPVPLNQRTSYLSNCREVAILGIKGTKPTFNSSYDKGLYEYPIYQGKDRIHPTQKPLLLFEELIKKHSNEGELVLDCFAGSATTAIACVNTNRDFVGCELDANYYELASKRIASYES